MDEWDLVHSEAKGMTIEQLEGLLREREMFHPPLPGSVVAGIVLCQVPLSDVKYASFLEWWFAVGRKAPELARDGWARVVGPHASKGKKGAIPKEDWERLEQSEREAIREWAYGISVGIHFSRS